MLVNLVHFGNGMNCALRKRNKNCLRFESSFIDTWSIFGKLLVTVDIIPPYGVDISIYFFLHSYLEIDPLIHIQEVGKSLYFSNLFTKEMKRVAYYWGYLLSGFTCTLIQLIINAIWIQCNGISRESFFFSSVEFEKYDLSPSHKRLFI